MNWIKNKLFLNQFRYYKILFVLKCSQCKYSTKKKYDSTSWTLGVGLEPCNYIRGFISSIKLFIQNSTYNKIGYIGILTDNIEETKKFYSTMCGWEYEKSEDKEEEKYWLIKNAGVKGAITSKRENNQTPTFYIIVESIDDFIAKSQKQGAKVIVNKQEISEGFYATIQDQQNNTFGL